MALSRLEHYSTKEDNITNILYQLLDVYGNPQYARYGFAKKLRGYGLKQSEFSLFKDTAYPTTERKFREYKEELLARYMIEEFYTKRNNVGRPYYKLTVIGIAYLIKHIKKLTKNIISVIYKIITEYSNPKDKTIQFDAKLWKNFEENEITTTLKQVGHFIEFDLGVEGTFVRFDAYMFKTKNRIAVFIANWDSHRFQIDKSHIQTVWTENFEPITVNQEQFYFDLSYSLNIMITYYIIQNMKNQFDNYDKLPQFFRDFCEKSHRMIDHDLSNMKMYELGILGYN